MKASSSTLYSSVGLSTHFSGLRVSWKLVLSPLVTYERFLHNDLRLSDGFVIPAHTQIGVPAHAIGFDPSIYPDPNAFDGLRFYKLRQSSPDSAGQQQYTAANLSNMSWGYGKHACPGRWFADAEIKAILCHLLIEYEFKLPDGHERPKSFTFETQNLPDKEAKVLIRKRAEAVVIEAKT